MELIPKLINLEEKETSSSFELNILTANQVKSVAIGSSHYLFVTLISNQAFSWGANSMGKK